MTQAIIFILMALSLGVVVLLLADINAWALIVSYWIFLIIKNFMDWRNSKR